MIIIDTHPKNGFQAGGNVGIQKAMLQSKKFNSKNF
jgi:hypothetical protein